MSDDRACASDSTCHKLLRKIVETDMEDSVDSIHGIEFLEIHARMGSNRRIREEVRVKDIMCRYRWDLTFLGFHLLG